MISGKFGAVRPCDITAGLDDEDSALLPRIAKGLGLAMAGAKGANPRFDGAQIQCGPFVSAQAERSIGVPLRIGIDGPLKTGLLAKSINRPLRPIADDEKLYPSRLQFRHHALQLIRLLLAKQSAKVTYKGEYHWARLPKCGHGHLIPICITDIARLNGLFSHGPSYREYGNHFKQLCE